MRRLSYILLTIMFLTSCNKTEEINNNILRLYGDALEDIGYGITKAEDGYVITGQLTEVARTETNVIDKEHSVKKMGIIKTNLNGDVVWKKLYGDQAVNVGSRAVVLNDGSVICVGYAVDKVTQLKDVFIVKTDAQGNAVAQKVFKNSGDIYNQYGVEILKTATGFLVLGVTDAERIASTATDSTGNVAGKKDILVMNLDNSFSEIETWAAGYPGNDEAVSVKPDIGGGYIVVATTDRSDKKDPNIQSKNNILIVKINAQGKFTQQRIIGGAAEENAADLEVLDDGYLIVSTVGAEGSQSGYVWELSQNIFAAPVYEHALTLGSSSETFRINAVSRYKTSYFVMAGQAGTGSSARMLVFITDDEGNLLEQKSVISGGTGSQAVNDVIADDQGNIYAVGKNSYENNSMISLLKFRF